MAGRIKTRYSRWLRSLLNLKELPKPDDAADALAISLCHAHTGQFQQLLFYLTGMP
jgi:crossover junction endodeoxyribonuclease RuvC